MALEIIGASSYINSLNESNPAATDALGQADDHLRAIKKAVKNTFPNVTGEVTADHSELSILDGATVTTAELNVLDGIPSTLTATELGYVDGVTSSIQTQIDTKAPSADATLTGTTDVARLDIGDFTIEQSGTGDTKKLVIKVGSTVLLSLSHDSASSNPGDLKINGDVSAFDDP